MSDREERFIKFLKFLWEEHPECFQNESWTEKFSGEEWFFSVFLRTIIWNDPESEKLYKQIDGLLGTLKKYKTLPPTKFEEWFNEEQHSIKVGGKDQGGAHRKLFHRKDNPKALR